MKSPVLVLVFVFSSVIGSAQKFKSVDNITSFQNIAFDSSPESQNGSLDLDLIISYGLKYYKFKSRELKEISGFKIHAINLGFRDDKLEYMDFYFKKLSSDDFTTLRTSLEREYGYAKEIEPIEVGVVQAVTWAGDNVTLNLYRFESDANDLEDRNKTVLAVSKSLIH
ncbi:MAG TPA: hypothetical protein PKL31_08405 [Fulvivirga sp.]|nr:hypothetical protein [Fulvivirga sp.]